MIVRRLLLTGAALAAVVTASIGVAPTAKADVACAWVDPHGYCVTNPLPSLPRLPLP